MHANVSIYYQSSSQASPELREENKCSKYARENALLLNFMKLKGEEAK
jgi:hypothetical protein